MTALHYAVRNEVMRNVVDVEEREERAESSNDGHDDTNNDDNEEVSGFMSTLNTELKEASGRSSENQCSANRGENDPDSVVDLGCEPGKEYMKIVELLLENNANVNIQDGSGKTVVMIAASAGHEALVRMIMEKGSVDLGIVDKNGFGSITYAKTKEIREIIVKHLL